VTGGDERVAHVWDVASGNERFRLDHGASLERVAVSPDGGTVLTLGENGKGKLWSSENGQPLHELAHGCGARGAAFFAGGRLAATWSEANRFTGCPGRVLTWEVQSGQPLSTMPIAGDTKPGFSSDGRRMWGEPPAESVRPVARVEALQVWDVATAEQRFAEPFLHEDRIQSADFSPDGQLLLTAAGRQVTVWVVGGRDLQAVLDAATTVCLTPAFRRQNLGETEGDARRRHTDCERKHGRE
jgi:WD40 repeat protein